MCDKIEHIADFVYIKKDRIWDIMEAIALLLRNRASGPCHF